MKSWIITLATLASVSASAMDCNITAPQLVQKIAQLNGLRGNLIESAYSANLFLVTVDKKETFAAHGIQKNGKCIVDEVAYAPAEASPGSSQAECNVKAEQVAQLMAESNGEDDSNITMAWSSGDQFLPKVGAFAYSVRESSDKSCTVEHVTLQQ